MGGFEVAVFSESVEEEGVGIEGVRRRAVGVDPVEELEGEDGVVSELEEDVFDSEWGEGG